LLREDSKMQNMGLMQNTLLPKTYWPKHQPPHTSEADYVGVSLRVGLSRSIFLGAIERSISNDSAPRAQKGYLRISLTLKPAAFRTLTVV